MLVRKSVLCTETEMQLQDEAGNHVHSYDIEGDQEMCAFLTRMIQLGVYELRDNPGMRRRQDAA